jgi:AcrR family transcriptional regulator
VRRRGLDRERVLALAAEIADREGLEELSLARLARELGIRAPSLYNHLDGLEGLRRALALRGLGELGERLRGAAVGRAGGDALRAFAGAYREYVLEHPGSYAAAVRAPVGGDAEHERAARAVVEVLFAVLRAWELEGEDLIHAARGVRSALHGFVSLERTGGFGIPVAIESSYEALVELLVVGLDALNRTV